VIRKLNSNKGIKKIITNDNKLQNRRSTTITTYKILKKQGSEPAAYFGKEKKKRKINLEVDMRILKICLFFPLFKFKIIKYISK